MPELPEVECVRLSLGHLLVGRRIASVRVKRAGVIEGSRSPAALLVGDRVDRVLRQGKQLAILGKAGGCINVHLGMSGQLCLVQHAGQMGPQTQRRSGLRGSPDLSALPPHTHVVWHLDDGQAVRFTDPRRFGGLWTFAGLDELRAVRWSSLGPDALTIAPADLAKRLSGTTRCLKAALLDQQLIAGLGNIYVDELLYSASLHPLLPADRLPAGCVPDLVRRMRTLLRGAIRRGGSSLRDYVNARNERGTQQERHRVYGRAGQPCQRKGCGGTIASTQVGGRTTAWCPICQRIGAI